MICFSLIIADNCRYRQEEAVGTKKVSENEAERSKKEIEGRRGEHKRSQKIR